MCARATRGKIFFWVPPKGAQEIVLQVFALQKKWKLAFEIFIWVKNNKLFLSRNVCSRHRKPTFFWVQPKDAEKELSNLVRVRFEKKNKFLKYKKSEKQTFRI